MTTTSNKKYQGAKPIYGINFNGSGSNGIVLLQKNGVMRAPRQKKKKKGGTKGQY